MNRSDVVAIAFEVVRGWQANLKLHPLTCGRDSSHPVLEAEDVDGAVRLYCAACDWTQALPRPLTELILDRIKERVG